MNERLISFGLKNGLFHYTRIRTEEPDNSQHQAYRGRKKYQLFYLLSGQVSYQIEGVHHRLRPGDLIILNNREQHRPYFESDAPYERILVFFESEFCAPYRTEGYNIVQFFERRKPGSFNRLPADLVEKAGVYAAFEEMESLGRQNQPHSKLLIELTFIRLLIQLNELVATHPNVFELKYEYHEKIEQIIAYVNANLARELSLLHIEQTFHMNKYYFAHLFKKMTGLSFKQYVIAKRLGLAAEMLKLGVPPTEAARRAGFDDYSNFYKAFKRFSGSAPSAYKG